MNISYVNRMCGAASQYRKNENIGLAMAIPPGLEPGTPCLEGRCSIQLSYGTFIKLIIIKDIKENQVLVTLKFFLQ